MSHLFAYLSRMKYINRWELMRNTQAETISEHSLRVAMIAHGLAVIRNRVFEGDVNAEHVAMLALFHDVSEVITGDLPMPIKYFNPEIQTAYKQVEAVANDRFVEMAPEEVREDYAALLTPGDEDAEAVALVKAADKICAFLKCEEELSAGNQEFRQAHKALAKLVDETGLPEVAWFMKTYAPSFALTLDELG